ncbi:MAG: hypothetical protein Q8P31_00780 [Bacillota bacterium]|nr:hypothetical protein [Bacillota bacterium]
MSIIGYSFPEADADARTMFARALARNKRLRGFLVANPNDHAVKTAECLVRKMKAVRYQSFEELCERLVGPTAWGERAKMEELQLRVSVLQERVKELESSGPCKPEGRFG